MKQRTRAELQEDCSRKSSDPCYLLTVGLQTSQTRAGDEVSTRLSLPRGAAPHQSQLHFCSVSLFRETERKDSSKQTQMVGFVFFFLSSDLLALPFLTLPFQELCFTCRAYFSSRNIWGWEETDHSEQLLFPCLHQPSCSRIQVPSVTTEWGEELWEFALAQAKAGRTGRGLT